ncbi:MAG TPA: N-6 DNA methylase [Acidobacteriota bacterium]|nr:N-6 DNA methylase [Acidobacteriota bacterium]HQM64712.1 N-6 DNA methylase [Acidobacteriota bacterium]
MLDSETRRRIDTARDILVGKVPDPKSQVEQITIALIYKFMDDMDAEAEELGGQRKFFAGDFARYGWSRLMRAGLGGHETLNLYAEAITRMPENPGIPPLFRDIFKNAFLPYRDPETLRAFLKIIDEFQYDHSERLGDAFEYLLSVLGSQGDAGQFRTPRHIIDFIVAIVDPKKTDTVLDPACGTAGFLISSYKHILKANADARGQSTLTPDEKGRLARNFKGYDISPDMVRLSLVNMYLHGFTDPHIHEYDTLTSLDKWNEHADVILANPPFMSPKGGIRPHNRFSVQSKRSEVLFVDYIAEHLTPNGRAGVIVPEGIIFQSQTAYKQLRRMLVEDCLVAVVSLPAGVFNPYSGVKTSILILDKALAKQSNTIAFFKIENDGFGLGAQRRPIDKNDLPQARAEIAEYLRRLRARESLEAFEPTLGLIVAKEKVAASGVYNLSGERYREASVSASKFPAVELGELCELVRGVVYAKEDEIPDGGVQVLRANNINKDRFELDLEDIKHVSPKAKFSDEKKLRRDDIFICLASGSKDHIGKVALVREDTDFYFGGFMGAIRVRPGRLHPSYLLKQLTTGHFNDFLREQIAGANINNLSGALLYRFKIPLPPLEVQKEIVAEIEGYQKVIDGARAVVDNYRPNIPIDPKWQMVQLGETCDIFNGSTPSRKKACYWDNGTIPWFTVDDIRKKGRVIRETIQSVSERALIETSLKLLPANSVLLCCTASVGEYAFTEIELTTNQQFNGLVVNKDYSDRLFPKFLFHLSAQFKDELLRLSGKTSFNFVSCGTLKTIKIPLPPLDTQRSIVAEIEAEQALINSSRELIARMEKKIQATISRVWEIDH